MSLFRDEEHARSWCRLAGYEPGYAMTLSTLWPVARVWYHGRLDEAPLTRTRDDKQRILDAAGLTGPFWRLP